MRRPDTIEQILLRQLVIFNLNQPDAWLPLDKIEWHERFTRNTLLTKVAQLRREEILEVKYRNATSGGITLSAIRFTSSGRTEAIKRIIRAPHI